MSIAISLSLLDNIFSQTMESKTNGYNHKTRRLASLDEMIDSAAKP
jgi:hypothetical protein